MFVDNIVANADVNRERDTETDCRGKNTYVLVRERAIENSPAQCFAQSQPGLRSLANSIVYSTGLFPQPKLAGANVACHAFGRRSDQGKLPIMDRASAVHANVANQAPLHHVD